MRHRVRIDSLFLRFTYACTLDSILLLFVPYSHCLRRSTVLVFCESGFSVIY